MQMVLQGDKVIISQMSVEIKILRKGCLKKLKRRGGGAYLRPRKRSCKGPKERVVWRKRMGDWIRKNNAFIE